MCGGSFNTDPAADSKVFVAHACLCTCTHLLVCVGCADLMTLDTMSPQERKRQGYIHELIHTEETYVEDLELVLEVSADTDGQIQEETNSCVKFFLRWSIRSSISRCLTRAV